MLELALHLALEIANREGLRLGVLAVADKHKEDVWRVRRDVWPFHSSAYCARSVVPLKNGGWE